MNNRSVWTSLVIVFLLVFTTPVFSAALSLTVTQPAVGSNDISNLVGAGPDQDNVGTATADGGGNDATTYISYDRPAQGQTFMTPSDYPAYRVDAVTVQHAGYTSNTNTTWYRMSTGGQFTIRVTNPAGSGSSEVVLDSETYTLTGSEPDIFSLDTVTNTANGTGTWVTFTFDTPIILQPNTHYGFDIASNTSFFETLGIKDTATGGNPYAEGTAYISGANGSPDNTLINAPGDRVFIVHLAPQLPDNGDLTGNGKVDLEDIAVLSDGWQNLYSMDVLMRIASNWLSIDLPAFKSDPIVEADGQVDMVYNSTLTDDVTYYDASKLIYSKTDGPAWLTVAANGDLSGTPAMADVGPNTFTVQADDGVNTPIQAALQMTVSPPADSLNPVYLNNFVVQGFWATQYKRQITHWLIHCIDKLNTDAVGIPQFIEAKKALDGLPHASRTGNVWDDAYVHNTVESMCLALSIDANGDTDVMNAQAYIRTQLEAWIPRILAVQQSDGYIDTLVINTIDNGYVRYSNSGNHESYVQAYFIESGIAHYQMTAGQDLTLYNAAKKCGDHFYQTFLVPHRLHQPGHEVIEMALCRLGRLVNEVEGRPAGDKYIETAKWLLDCRGGGGTYDQNHLPVIQQNEAVGHAVRAVYLYTGMTDIAMLQQNTDYLNAVNHLWDSAVNRKMYLTGGVGATSSGEAFSADYELPNTGYCETCASCGLIFWNQRMNWYYRDAKYANVVERAIYNNVLSAVDLAGENFYYQQPLDQDNARYSWHFCPCCVSNITRTLLALKDNAYLLNKQKDSLYVNYFIAGKGTINDVAGQQTEVEQVTNYPCSGIVNIIIRPQAAVNFTVKIRIPDRTESALYTATPEINGYNSIQVNGAPVTPAVINGYVAITRTWNPGDTITLDLPMEIQLMKADTRVTANLGRTALQYGPLVYNLESVDQSALNSIFIDSAAGLTTSLDTGLLGEEILKIQGTVKLKTTGGIQNTTILAIPNYARLNRGGRSMVWVADNESTAAAVPAPGNELIWSGDPYTLNGSSDYIMLPDNIVAGCSDFTVAAWVWLDTRSAWARIFDFGSGTGINMFLTPQSGSNTLRFAITRSGGGGEQQINAAEPLPTGSWQHVAVTLSGTTGKLYLNGSEIAGNSISIAPYLLGATNQNYIGKSQYNDPYLDGQVRDFRVYNYALSQSNIAALAASQP